MTPQIAREISRSSGFQVPVRGITTSTLPSLTNKWSRPLARNGDVFRGRQDAGNCQIEMTDLADGQTYFWRVDEVTDSKTHRGDVWSFTTYDRKLATFEEFDSDEELQSRWAVAGDGTATLSQVEPSSGQRSLQLESRGGDTKAEFTFASNQDWFSSAHSFRSLKMHFKGQAENQISKLYLAVEDNDWERSQSVVQFDGAFSRAEAADVDDLGHRPPATGRKQPGPAARSCEEDERRYCRFRHRLC